MPANNKNLPKGNIPGNDVDSLFSNFSGYYRPEIYRELVRDSAADQAAARWPLLSELEGLGAPKPEDGRGQ